MKPAEAPPAAPGQRSNPGNRGCRNCRVWPNWRARRSRSSVAHPVRFQTRSRPRVRAGTTGHSHPARCNGPTCSLVGNCGSNSETADQAPATGCPRGPCSSPIRGWDRPAFPPEPVRSSPQTRIVVWHTVPIQSKNPQYELPSLRASRSTKDFPSRHYATYVGINNLHTSLSYRERIVNRQSFHVYSVCMKGPGGARKEPVRMNPGLCLKSPNCEGRLGHSAAVPQKNAILGHRCAMPQPPNRV